MGEEGRGARMMVFTKPVGDGQDEGVELFVDGGFRVDARVAIGWRVKRRRLRSSTDLIAISMGCSAREEADL